MQPEIEKLAKEIEAIKERNRRVEAAKAWEGSKTRIVSLVIITYLLAALVLYLLGNDNYWFNALIPTIGFFLSAQSLPMIKKWWLKKYIK